MYVDTSTLKRGTKTYTRYLLRTSFREEGKVKHKTIANLSSCTAEEIAAIKFALKHKHDLTALGSLKDAEISLEKRIGAVWTVNIIAERLGIKKVLGTGHQGKLALLQIISRLIGQGSRLSTVRFAKRHAVCEILGINKLDENDLYKNLSWLSEHQETIEQALFKVRFHDTVPTLFLYDVTSSYLEGTCNELANWGYNRDKKRGKMQIVVGLLVGPDGMPVAIRVFEGNTNDPKTVSEQIRILKEGFGVKDVTLIGDRGMIKGPQIELLPDDFRYVTAITKPQIRKMLREKVLQYELFAERVCEIAVDGIRYILRRNPMRALQMAETREGKFAAIITAAEKQTRYLADHPRADAVKALEKVRVKIKKLKADKWLAATEEGRVIRISKDEAALAEVSQLDGCYVIKSNVCKQNADAQVLHDRYCDLETVERIFRTFKTTHLELRPIYVRKKGSTCGHAFVVMLALLVQRELERLWSDLDITVEEGINELAAIHTQKIRLGKSAVDNIPIPNEIGIQLLKTAGITLPSVFPHKSVNVHTKKKLQSGRKRKRLQDFK